MNSLPQIAQINQILSQTTNHAYNPATMHYTLVSLERFYSGTLSLWNVVPLEVPAENKAPSTTGNSDPIHYSPQVQTFASRTRISGQSRSLHDNRQTTKRAETHWSLNPASPAAPAAC